MLVAVERQPVLHHQPPHRVESHFNQQLDAHLNFSSSNSPKLQVTVKWNAGSNWTVYLIEWFVNVPLLLNKNEKQNTRLLY